MAKQKVRPGWYRAPDMHRMLRYSDGDQWKGEMTVESDRGRDAATQIATVAVGVLVAWFAIWLGAQVAPDVFYFPIKFLVEDLPDAFVAS